jgi:hypothetical protein
MLPRYNDQKGPPREMMSVGSSSKLSSVVGVVVVVVVVVLSLRCLSMAIAGFFFRAKRKGILRSPRAMPA